MKTTYYYTIKCENKNWSDLPQESIELEEWFDFVIFCRKLSANTGKEIRGSNYPGYNSQGFYFFEHTPIKRYEYNPSNPRSLNAKLKGMKKLDIEYQDYLSKFPNFHKTGSITGMKRQYYGKGALLVKCGQYIYNVTSEPILYYKYAE